MSIVGILAKELKMGRDDEVRVIAYRIWQEAGCPDGCHEDHWYRAEIIWEDDQKKKESKEQPKAATKPVVKPRPQKRFDKKLAR